MERVRAAARFVFRDEPEIVREATSAYDRKKRADRRAAAEANEPEPVVEVGPPYSFAVASSTSVAAHSAPVSRS